MIKYFLLNDGRTVIGEVEEDDYLQGNGDGFSGSYFVSRPVGFFFTPNESGFNIQWFDVIPPGGKSHDFLFDRGILLECMLTDEPLDDLKKAYLDTIEKMTKKESLIQVVPTMPSNLRKM